MSQSVLFSFSEQFVNTLLGFIIGCLFLLYVINPLFSLSLTFISSIEVSIIMFLVSMLRGFLLRRLFVRFNDIQTFKISFFEKVMDVGLGFVVATAVWSFILMPAYDINTSFFIDIIINALFFMANLTRALFVRRLFERIHQRRLTIQEE